VIRMIHTFSILALICAGLLFGRCGVQWLQSPSLDGSYLRTPISEHLRTQGSLTGGNNATPTPLVQQAEAFAQYLNPPKPPAQMGTAAPVVAATPAPRPPGPTPQFKLLAISHYRSHPEMSLAMVWDPSNGGTWVRQGDHLGHFVVERIEKDAIFYRDGDQLHQMAMTIKEPAQLARLKSKGATSSQNITANETLVSASQ